jgi:hypothetical protein
MLEMFMETRYLIMWSTYQFLIQKGSIIYPAVWESPAWRSEVEICLLNVLFEVVEIIQHTFGERK